MIYTPHAVFSSVLLLLIIAAVIPAATAMGNETLWADNPEHVAVLQAYAAYSGALYKARMDGAIRYAGTLNVSGSTGNLTADEEHFLAAAASTSSMTRSSEVYGALGTMKNDLSRFRSNLTSVLAKGKGSQDALGAAINSSVATSQGEIRPLEDEYWTLREVFRTGEFSITDALRMTLLEDLASEGADVSRLEALENQSMTAFASLQSAFLAHDEASVQRLSSLLDALNRQFATTARDLAWQQRSARRLVSFDNATARMQDQVSGLSADGSGGTAARSILSQINALRPRMAAALMSRNESAITAVDAQILALDTQFTLELQRNRAGTDDDNATTTLHPAGYEPGVKQGEQVSNQSRPQGRDSAGNPGYGGAGK